HTKLPQIEPTLLRCWPPNGDKHSFSSWGWAPWVRNLGGPFCSGANGRRRRSPSTRNIRQSLGHGRGVLCPHARGRRSRTRKSADWCHHHAWEPTIRNTSQQNISGRKSLRWSIWTFSCVVPLMGRRFLPPSPPHHHAYDERKKRPQADTRLGSTQLRR